VLSPGLLLGIGGDELNAFSSFFLLLAAAGMT
jgi:hypothetical protein